MTPRHRRGPDGLTRGERLFCLAYIANGFKNATAAYRAVSPRASQTTCRSSGSEWMARPHVRAFLDARLVEHFSGLNITGAEVMGRVVQDARATVAELCDQDGNLLKPHEWPATAASSVEVYEVRADGSQRIRLVNKQHARRLLLEVTRMLDDPEKDQASLWERLIRSDQARRGGAAAPSEARPRGNA